MSKAVKWQVPFDDVKGVQKRVDIYAEYTGSVPQTWPIVLQAGDSPFVTEEDSSDDMFAPVRVQTGTLSVCTQLPSGGMITMDDMLPSSNVSNAVRLVDVATGNVEWAGFLSCEAYSQSWRGVAENIELNVIGMLEAMKSAQIQPREMNGIMTIRQAIVGAMDLLETISGWSVWGDVYVSMSAWRILQQYVNMTAMFEVVEIADEESTVRFLSGISALELLEKVCTMMGWTVRESGRDIYFQRIGDEIGYLGSSFSQFKQGNYSPTALETISMDDMEWRGNDHKRTWYQGAKSVSVTAEVEENEMDLGIPDCPTSSLVKKSGHKDGQYYKFYYTTDQSLDIQCYYSTAELTRTWNVWDEEIANAYSSNLSDMVSHMVLTSEYPSESPGRIMHIELNPLVHTTHTERFYAGAVLCKVCHSEDEQTESALSNGLLCALYPGVRLEENGVEEFREAWEMETPMKYMLTDGKLVFSARLTNMWEDNTVFRSSQSLGKLYFKLAIETNGTGKWWNGEQWISTETFFVVNVPDHADGWDIDIPVSDEEILFGKVFMSMSSKTNAQWIVISGGVAPSMSAVDEVLFTQLEVKWEPTPHVEKRSKSNHYYKRLDTAFKDEITIETELASDNNNVESPSVLVKNPYTNAKMRDMLYSTDYNDYISEVESRRPEKDLLNRLASYYGDKRCVAEIECERPTTALPLLSINGIDGKVYAPMAEERDWRMRVSKITCFEK